MPADLPHAADDLAPAAPDRRQRVQAAETAMAVLKLLAHLGGRASLTVIAMQAGESPAKVHRYLMSLMAQGLVEQDGTTQQYFLAREAMFIGLAAMRQADPIRVAEPALLRLRESLAVTCFIAVMGNKGPTIVRFEEPGLPVSVNARVGSVMSVMWSATGRAFLALLDEPQIQGMALSELSAAPAELRAQLDPSDPVGVLRREVLAAGCASVVDTHLRGISAVSCWVRDWRGAPQVVLTALGATGGFDASVSGPVAQAVRQACAEASASLGYRPAQG